MANRLYPRFEDSPEGKRRSVFFAIGIATGFVCIAAAASALWVSPLNAPVAAVLIILGSMAFGFATMTALGRLDWVFEL